MQDWVGYECLIRQVHGQLDDKGIQLVVAAHIDAGVDHLKRVRSLADLLTFTSNSAVKGASDGNTSVPAL